MERVCLIGLKDEGNVGIVCMDMSNLKMRFGLIRRRMQLRTERIQSGRLRLWGYCAFSQARYFVGGKPIVEIEDHSPGSLSVLVMGTVMQASDNLNSR